jgi:hypothetical protein
VPGYLGQEGLRYTALAESWEAIANSLPAINGWRITAKIVDYAAIGQTRLDYLGPDVSGRAAEPHADTGTGLITVVLHVDRADIAPAARTIWLDDLVTEPMSFVVTPRRAGPTAFRFRSTAPRPASCCRS